MFWRKTRAAIGQFHPAHQTLVWHHVLSTTLDGRGWAQLIASLHQHSTLVKRRKWALPHRTLDVVVPIVETLCQDLPPGGVLAVTADLRGVGVPEKAGPPRALPCRRPVRSISEWYVVDPWLRLRAELRDGSVLDLAATDRVRYRRIKKVNPRGKHKTKTKNKWVQRIRVTRVVPRDLASTRPPAAPPPWIRVRLRDGKRRTLTAIGRLPGSPPGSEQVHHLLAVVAEPFRWTPVGAARPDRRSA